MIKNESVEKLISHTSTTGKKLKVSDKLMMASCVNNGKIADPIKTPVSILQEMMIKNGEYPKYDIREDELLSQVFHCVVTCNGLSATGQGCSKKDAKQAAAQNMIEKMQESTVELNSTKAKKEKLENEDNKNYVSKLQSICSKQILEKPEFKIEKNSDSTYFICHCNVSTLQTIGKGETRKKAMNNTAKKMIDELNDIFIVGNSSSNTVHNNEIPKMNVSTNLHKSAFCEKEKVCFDESTSENFWIEIKQLLASTPSLKILLEYISNLANEFCNKLHKNIENISVNKVEKLMIEFYDFLKAVKISFDEIVLKGSDNNSYLYMIQLNISSEIIEKSLGSTKEEAQLRTIKKVIKIFEKKVL